MRLKSQRSWHQRRHCDRTEFVNTLADYTLIYYKTHQRDLLLKTCNNKEWCTSFRLTLSHSWNLVQITPLIENLKQLFSTTPTLEVSPTHVHFRDRKDGFNCPSSRTLLRVCTVGEYGRTRVADRLQDHNPDLLLVKKSLQKSLWAPNRTAQRQRRHQQGCRRQQVE